VPPILADAAANPPRPGDLVANSELANAIVLRGQSLITGDLQTAGEVQADNPGADIWGEVRAHCDPVELPKVDVASYDPAVTGKPHSSLDAPPEDNPRLSGVVRFNSSQVIPGTLTLDSALVFVKGDLTVKGGVKGKGALVVTGTTRLENGATLDAGNRLTLLGQGKVEILGSGKQSSAFQGIVYTEADFTVEKITVVGALFARGGADSVVRLGECNLLANPEVEQLAIQGGGLSGHVMVPSAEGLNAYEPYYSAGLVDLPYVLARVPQTAIPLSFERTPGKITVRAQVSWLEQIGGERTEFSFDPADGAAAGDLYGYLSNRVTVLRGIVLPPPDLTVQLALRILSGPPLVPPTVPFADALRANVKVRLGGTDHTFQRSDPGELLRQVNAFTESGGGETFRFDPSQFLKFEDRARISLWRTL